MTISQTIAILTAIVGAEAMESQKAAIVNQTIFLPKSFGNVKLGFCTSTYSPRYTCPACPFKACGACYAEQNNCKRWFGVAAGEPYKGNYLHINLADLKSRLESQPTTKIIRHNVSGDLCTGSATELNAALIIELIKAYKGHKAYTYTHAPKTEKNLAIIKAANQSGNFVINASCENLTQVKAALAAGVPAVLAVDKMPEKDVVIDGIAFHRCPAAKVEEEKQSKIAKAPMTCANCKLCTNCKRKCVPVFPVHGGAANKARKAGFLIPELSEKAFSNN